MFENNKCQADKYLNASGCYIMGPTGPAGPPGPATITIGSTTTGLPGTNATVTNSGTSSNVVLDFSIPRGAAGATGPTGPQGESGPRGIPGQVGVQGPTGPTGPTGPAATDAFGRKYNNNVSTVALDGISAKNIPLTSPGPSSGITTGSDNALTITEDGTYKIDYYFRGSSSADATITVEINENGGSIGSSSIVKTVTNGVITEFIGSSINELKNGELISLDIKSTAPATITGAAGTNAYLNIFKI